MPFLLALWVARGVSRVFALHGGFVAALIYGVLPRGQAQLQQVAHGLKIVGGIADGVVASRRKLVEG